MGVVGHAFKKYVEEKTGGKWKRRFYGGSLGDESEAFRNVQKGTASGHGRHRQPRAPFEKKLGLLTLPYLFANIDEVVAGTNGAPRRTAEQVRHQGPGSASSPWTYDFRYISNQAPHHQNGRHAGPEFPRAPERRARSPPRPSAAASDPIPGPKSFTALQQGVVDGQCYGYIGFKAMKFNEANQKYLTEVHYTYQLQPLVISERVFKKMTPKCEGHR